MDLRILLLLLISASCGSAARLLLLPSDHTSHVNLFTIAARELQSRGHEAILLAPKRHKHILKEANIQYVLFDGPESPEDNQDIVNSLLFSSGLSHLMNYRSFRKEMSQAGLDICYRIMHNGIALDNLKTHQFDLVVMDSSDTSRCLYVLPYKLGIPYITMIFQQNPWNVGTSAFSPVDGFSDIKIMKKDSGYLQTFTNLAIHVLAHLLPPPLVNKDYQTKELAPEKPETTYHHLYEASEVFLINSDYTCFDYPRMEGSHHRFVGGMSAIPVKALPQEFEDFVSKASDGLTVVSFGTLSKQIPSDMLDKMLSVFRDIPQHVVIHHDGQMKDVPGNVMLSKWLPQNDLLAHNYTRLFITHGGNNGQLEGSYQCVPMIIMPFTARQMHAASQIVDKNFGLMLHPVDFTTNELRKAIKEMLNNPIYGQNIKKCSDIAKFLPPAHAQIDFWVKHVLKFGGGNHLKLISKEMPLYEVFMLNVALIVFCAATSCVLYKCCKCTWRSSKSKGRKKMKTK